MSRNINPNDLVKRGRHPADPTGKLMGDTHWPLPTRYDVRPDMYAAFDTKKVALVGTGEYKTLWHLATVTNKVKPENVAIGPIEKATTYSVFDQKQLAHLYKGLTSQPIPPSDDYSEMLEMVQMVVAEVTPEPTPEFLLAPVLNRQAAQVDEEDPTAVVVRNRTTAKPTNKPAPTPREKTTGPATPAGRPKAGSTTGQVWDIADAIKAKNPDMDKKEIRNQVVAKCEAAGINKSTASVQFGKWWGSKN